MAKKKKSVRAEAPKPKKKRYALWGAGLAGVGAIAAVALFFWVDGLVSRRLALPSSGIGSAILSDTITVSSSTSAEGIVKALASRDYSRTDDIPSSAGQYRAGTEGLEVFRRAYVGIDGVLRPAELQRVTADSAVTLEPSLLVPLGTNEQKASEKIALEKIPPIVWQAIIAVEDERFYSHYGVDPVGISRALYQNVTAGEVKQGGSTLTQQLAKNLFFSPERTLRRKVQEALAAISLEARLSKKQILELYLNETYFGQQGAIALHGVATAAHAFFGKKVTELTIPEAALIAGLIRAPSSYNPRRYPKRALGRRNTVIDKMVENRYISEREGASAKAAPLGLAPEALRERSAPYFSSYVQQSLKSRINLDAYIPQGIQIHSTIEPVLQRCAEDAVQEGLKGLEKKYARLKRKSELQAALVSMTPHGEIKAWVGGRDFSKSQFDRASQAERPIGSTIKPFVYLTALDKTLNSYKVATAQSILEDRPTEIMLETQNLWMPENYDKEFRGDVTLRYAVENSLNLPAVMITQKYGVRTLARLLQTMGLAEKVEPFPSIALGALNTTLLRLTHAYAGLANFGDLPSTTVFRSAIDDSGEVVLSGGTSSLRFATAPATYVLVDIMRGVIERGTGRSVRSAGFNAPAAGKTGTTNDARDAWFTGFTPSLVAGVWVGFDDNKTLGLTGGAAAAPIWSKFMQCAGSIYPAEDFKTPEGVVHTDIDTYSGLRWDASCNGDRVNEVFVAGTEPLESCARRSYAHREEEERHEVEDIEVYQRSPRRREEASFWDKLFGR